jgi:hypothetical protein
LRRSVTEEFIRDFTLSPTFLSSGSAKSNSSPFPSIEYQVNREVQTDDVYVYREDFVQVENDQSEHNVPSPDDQDTQSIRPSPFVYRIRNHSPPNKAPSPPSTYQDSQLIQNSPFVAVSTQVQLA